MEKKKKKWEKASWTIGQNAGIKPGSFSKKQASAHADKEQGGNGSPHISGAGEFINPYNFVRVELDEAKSERLPFANTFEKFHAGCLTGRIECTMKVITPLFIPDPEKTVESDGTNPKQMSFNRDLYGNPIIPSTSTKGMVRSVLEAVSNSCFSQIGTERLDYREARISQDLKPAVIMAVDDRRKKATIALLDEAAWLPAGYKGGSDYIKGIHKKSRFAYANIKKVPAKQKGNHRVPSHYVVTSQLQDNIASLPGPSKGERQYQVLIKHTENTIFNKHDERVFFSKTFPANLEANLNSLKKNYIPYARIRDFDYVLTEQYARFEKLKNEIYAHRAMKDRLNRSGPVRAQKGDLVYYYTPDQSLGLVLIPRMRYNNSPADLLPRHLRPCVNRQQLCPACRIFGTVDSDGYAFRGKVSFSPGRFEAQQPKFAPGVLLKILGSPQPTSTNFYLTGKEYDNTQPVTVKEKGYDRPDTILRGRKFYWIGAGTPATNDASRFNSRVEFLASKCEDDKPTTFRFSVDFENLTSDELALLVWSLELENGMYHRLGMGKPIGLGLVKLAIDREKSFEVDYAGMKSYYQDIRTGLESIKKELKVGDLKKIVRDKYEATVNFNDLKSILSLDMAIAEMVKYPESERKGEFFGYQWFTENRETQPLLTIEEIKQGLKQWGWKGESA